MGFYNANVGVKKRGKLATTTTTTIESKTEEGEEKKKIKQKIDLVHNEKSPKIKSQKVY